MRKRRKTCSFSLTLLYLQVVKEEQLDDRRTIQQFIRQSNGGSRPKGQNVTSENYFAGKYYNFVWSICQKIKTNNNYYFTSNTLG